MTVRGVSNVTAISSSNSRAFQLRCRVDYTRVLATLLVRVQSRHVHVMQRGAQAAFRTCRQTAVHRAIECGAVLGHVNALRDHGCASTARSARPAGVDVACAQLGSGSCALAGAAAPIEHQSSIDSTRDEAYFEAITFVPHGTPSRRPA
jgi:hypothetical protein